MAAENGINEDMDSLDMYQVGRVAEPYDHRVLRRKFRQIFKIGFYRRKSPRRAKVFWLIKEIIPADLCEGSIRSHHDGFGKVFEFRGFKILVFVK